ncbi:glycoside hydrolase family 15 protein [Myxococcus stipitatus]|uniref:glycoside hydrolase family 15 protein n=1 Tax=Myxococcus stipitatus TaxID=83455 RepID=UPI001F2877AE|nr:glycoside hydrolase family 15 protein [Myxococcus stipitatus]MCE9670212.1 glycoside hydrolase family 15 protein [Myxococcus stipitatus]
MRPARIQDHAVIGDGHSAALVSRDGGVVWLCWPRFDSPSLFAAILDAEAGGGFWLSPEAPARVSREYLPDTNVLRTRFETDDGVLVVTDLMPIHDTRGGETQPERELLRCVHCERGEVTLLARYAPRPDFGRARPSLRDGGRLGWRLEHAGWLYTLLTDVPLTPASEGELRGRARLRSGARAHFSLTMTDVGPAVLPPLGRRAWERVDHTAMTWRRWAARCRYDGPYREAVVRSALALKLLTFGPSGAVVAAATTSLPEVPGGASNWDYRFCWVRDASFTARAFLGLGYEAEAESFVTWLLRATWLTQPRMSVLYDVYGRNRPDEEEVPGLRGYAGSRPVRVGNAAATQQQLDSYGEVIDAVAQLIRHGGALARDELRMLLRLGEYIMKMWDAPDEGIWEPRGGRWPHTFSRLSCWMALDRLLELHGRGAFRGLRVPAEHLRGVREQLWEELRTRAWNRQLRSYVRILDGDDVDADLLLMAWYGFEDACSERMRCTDQRIVTRLGARGGLLFRNEDDLRAGEGAFGICGFWRVVLLARQEGAGRDAAERLFVQQLAHANDLGLLAEEVAPETGDALGNFPQALSHVGLISAALELEATRPWQGALGGPGEEARP